jgi:hypothetical protein
MVKYLTNKKEGNRHCPRKWYTFTCHSKLSANLPCNGKALEGFAVNTQKIATNRLSNEEKANINFKIYIKTCLYDEVFSATLWV